MASNTVTRYYFMDSMRAVLMTLGIVLHTAQIYNPTQTWLIYNTKSSSIANYLVEILTVFRMPAFFVVSGFFCLLTIQKYDVATFLTIRLKRLAIPLVSAAIILNSLQSLLLIEHGWLTTSLEQYLAKGMYISHLWFLINLIFYFLFTAFLFSMLQKLPIIKATLSFFCKIVVRVPILLIIVLLPLVSICVLALNKVGFPLYSHYLGFVNVYSLLTYLPFFAFGLLLRFSEGLLAQFSNIGVTFCTLLVIAGLLGAKQTSFESTFLETILNQYFNGITCWASVSLCFFVFYNFVNKPSRTWLYLSEASYSVYLFHHLIVISIGLYLMGSGISAIAGMALTIGSTLLLTLCIHRYMISKFKTLRYLFNGK